MEFNDAIHEGAKLIEFNDAIHEGAKAAGVQ